MDKDIQVNQFVSRSILDSFDFYNKSNCFGVNTSGVNL